MSLPLASRIPAFFRASSLSASVPRLSAERSVSGDHASVGACRPEAVDAFFAFFLRVFALAALPSHWPHGQDVARCSNRKLDVCASKHTASIPQPGQALARLKGNEPARALSTWRSRATPHTDDQPTPTPAGARTPRSRSRAPAGARPLRPSAARAAVHLRGVRATTQRSCRGPAPPLAIPRNRRIRKQRILE